MPRSNSPEPNVTPRHRYDKGVDNSKLELWSGPGNMFKFVVENGNGSTVFIQFFDAASVGDVTVGTTEPDAEYRVSGDGALGDDSAPEPLKWFNFGCIVAITTTRSGAGNPAVGSALQTWYQSRKSLGF